MNESDSSIQTKNFCVNWGAWLIQIFIYLIIYIKVWMRRVHQSKQNFCVNWLLRHYQKNFLFSVNLSNTSLIKNLSISLDFLRLLYLSKLYFSLTLSDSSFSIFICQIYYFIKIFLLFLSFFILFILSKSFYFPKLIHIHHLSKIFLFYLTL